MMTPMTPIAPFLPLTPAATLPRAHLRLVRDEPHTDDRLVTALAPRIRRVVTAVLGASHADLDDVVQLAMLAFVCALPSFRGECEPAHFASRIAARIAIASARRARAARARRDDGVEVDLLESASAEPLDDALRKRRRDALVRELLTTIPSEQAEALALRFLLGWSLPEVAEAAGAPINTVRSRLRLGRSALRAAIMQDPKLADELER